MHVRSVFLIRRSIPFIDPLTRIRADSIHRGHVVYMNRHCHAPCGVTPAPPCSMLYSWNRFQVLGCGWHTLDRKLLHCSGDTGVPWLATWTPVARTPLAWVSGFARAHLPILTASHADNKQEEKDIKADTYTSHGHTVRYYTVMATR